MAKPYMNPETHRLTDLPGDRHPHICQKCGNSNRPGVGAGIIRMSLARWQEHDHQGRPEHRLIVLCDKCSKAIIGPHPRLYSDLHPNHPWPGCMDFCVTCRWREGVKCSHPKAKANGGPGVLITIIKPISCMIDSTDYCGPLRLFTKPPESCREHEPVAP